MNKHWKTFALSAAMLCGMMAASCGGNSGGGSLPSDPSVGPISHSTEETYGEQATKAMENFASKIVGGNYNIVTDAMTTNVVNRNLIFFDSAPGKGNDVAAMSVGNETFQARTDMGGDIEHVIFVDKGNAIDVAKPQLPTHWFDEDTLGKDIWDLVEITEPNAGDDEGFRFKVKTTDTTIRDSVARWMALADFDVRALDVTTIDFDKEDVTKVTINGRYSDGTAKPSDVSVVINLGTAQSNEVAERWMANPNRAMPADVKDAGIWDTTCLTTINTTLMLATADEAMAWIPFMDFASYAVKTNMDTVLQDHYGEIRDYHGTIRDVENYKEKLVRENFTTKLNDMGEPVYRKVIRAKRDMGCYVNVEVNYDLGFGLKFYLTYDLQHYNTRTELNAIIGDRGFPAFSETDAVHTWFGEDDFFIQTENWSYFYDYDVYAVTNLRYEDLNAATAYIEAYGKALEELGFTRGVNSEINHWTLIDEDYETEFNYVFDGMGGLRIINKREVFADTAVMKATVEAAGFPEVDITSAKLVTTRDHKKFQHFYYVMECTAAYRNTFYFDDENEAKKFVGQYTQAILAAGFEQVKDTPYYMKDNLLFQPNDPAGGMCGLYFFIMEQE